MKSAMVLAVVLFAIVVAIGCSSGATTVIPTATPTQVPGITKSPTATASNPGVIKPNWITPQVDGENVSISLMEVNSGKMLHFELVIQGSEMTFMAYRLDGKTYVRASVCPPCHSRSFSLIGDILDCDSCHTKFKATTGEGVSGPCKNYPKAEVVYTASSDKIIMAMSDLATAYENTELPGLP